MAMAEKETILSIQAVKQLPSGAAFKTVAVVRRITRKMGKTGNLYLQIEVGDAIDTMGFNCFEGTQPFAFFQNIGERCPQIVLIEGAIDFYAEKLSPRIKSIIEIAPERYEEFLPRVVETPDEPIDTLKQELDAFIQSLEHDPLKATVQQVFDDLGDRFLESIAAVSMHHAYIHGLLEHTVHVTRLVDAMVPLYPDAHRDLAIAGALLHDVGKVLEYRYTTAEGMDRTTIGHLQGHVVLGYRLVHEAALKHNLDPHWQAQLEHIILSHPGQPEWGAAVFPATPEAILVGLADNADARMAMVHQQLKKALPGQVFSERVAGLETRVFTQGVPVPNEQNV